MEKLLFKNILSIVNENIDECKKYLDKVKTTEDLKNLTINQLMELRTICRKQQSRMDSVLRYELYHLIGMGQLTVIQQTQFLSLIKKWTTYRGDIKTIASNLSTIDSLPSLPTESTYDCRVLKVKLTSKGRVVNDFTQELLIDDIEDDVSDIDVDSTEDMLEAVCKQNNIDIKYLPESNCYCLANREDVKKFAKLLGRDIKENIFNNIKNPTATSKVFNKFNESSYAFDINVSATTSNSDKNQLIIHNITKAGLNRIENLYKELIKSK